MPIQMFSCLLIINLHITVFCMPLVPLTQFCPQGLNLAHCSLHFTLFFKNINPTNTDGLLSYRTQCFKVPVSSDKQIPLIQQAVGIRNAWHFFLIQQSILEEHMICMPQQLKTKILFLYIHMFTSNCWMELLNRSDPSYKGWLEVHMFVYHCIIFSTVIKNKTDYFVYRETNMAPWNQAT